MMKQFQGIQNYIGLFDGRGKPKLNFQEMYKLFPQFTFEPARGFGEYKNFGQAYEQKVYDMTITDEVGNAAFMVYREYGDADENLAYVS